MAGCKIGSSFAYLLIRDGDANLEDALNALRNGHTVASTGPFVNLTVSTGGKKAIPGDTIAVRKGEKVAVIIDWNRGALRERQVTAGARITVYQCATGAREVSPFKSINANQEGVVTFSLPVEKEQFLFAKCESYDFVSDKWYVAYTSPIFLDIPGSKADATTGLPLAVAGGQTKARERLQFTAPGEVKACTFAVFPGTLQSAFSINWPGSDFDLTLVRPNGRELNPRSSEPDYSYDKTPTCVYYAVDNPEPGEWTCVITAKDLPPGGEVVDVTLRVLEETPPKVSLEGFTDGSVLREPVTVVAQGYDADGFTDFILFLNDGELVSLPVDTAQSVVHAAYTLDPALLPDGEYTVSAWAADANFAPASAGLNFIVDHILPVADAGPDREVQPGEEVIFDASGSKDGAVFLWDFGDGAVEPSLYPYGAHVYENPGRYTVTLTVYDDAGNAAVDTARVTVRSTGNQPPVANAGGPYVSDEATTITFDASGSYDPDGDALQYRWDFDNDGAWDTDWSTTPVVSYTWKDDWAGTAKLEVSDGEFTATGIVKVTVNNVAPVVKAGPDQEITAGDAVSFSGSFTDPGWLDTHTAAWDFGDGVSQTGVLSEENNPSAAAGSVAGSHIYYNRGTYTVTLAIYDDDGGIGTDTLTVTVKPVLATANCEPDTLSLKSKGQWITVYIELPDGYDVTRIDIGSVKLNYRVPAEADTKYGFVKNPEIADRDGDGLPELMVKFNREAVKQILQPGEAVITVSGKVSHNGGLADFEGMAAISVIN